MGNRSETFGRLLKGAINSIAAYEGKMAPAVEEELGAKIGVAGSAIQRYKSGFLPPDARAVQLFAEAAVRRGYLGRAWLVRFLQAAHYPTAEALIDQLTGPAPVSATIPPDRAPPPPTGIVVFLFTDIEGSTTLWEQHPQGMQRALARHDAILTEDTERNYLQNHWRCLLCRLHHPASCAHGRPECPARTPGRTMARNWPDQRPHGNPRRRRRGTRR
jgi:hypothetical protein